MADLKACPFCGGDAELDTRQHYCAIGTGRPGSRIAAYCRDCGADIGICREDVPDVEPEHVIELWNRRPAAPEASRIMELVDELVRAQRDLAYAESNFDRLGRRDRQKDVDEARVALLALLGSADVCGVSVVDGQTFSRQTPMDESKPK